MAVYVSPDVKYKCLFKWTLNIQINVGKIVAKGMGGELELGSGLGIGYIQGGGVLSINQYSQIIISEVHKFLNSTNLSFLIAINGTGTTHSLLVKITLRVIIFIPEWYYLRDQYWAWQRPSLDNNNNNNNWE